MPQQDSAETSHPFSVIFFPSLPFPQMEIEPLPVGPTRCPSDPNEHNFPKVCAYCSTIKPSRSFKKYTSRGVSYRNSKCRDCQNECRMAPQIPYQRKYPSPRCRQPSHQLPDPPAIPDPSQATVQEQIDELFKTQGDTADFIDAQSERIKKLEQHLATLSSLLNDVLQRLPESTAPSKGQPVLSTPSSSQVLPSGDTMGRPALSPGDLSNRPWTPSDRPGSPQGGFGQAGRVQGQDPSAQAGIIPAFPSTGHTPPFATATIAGVPPMSVPTRPPLSSPFVLPLPGPSPPPRFPS